MSGTEILIILIVGIIVVGPKKLPGMMRTAGRWIARARRMTTEVRAQSGIDRLIREEGLENEIREISSLTRSNVLSSLAYNSIGSVERDVSAFAKNPLAASAAPAPKAAEAKAADASEADAAANGAAKKSALDLIKPAAGSVSRKPAEPEPSAGRQAEHDQALRALAATGLFSIREREYPTVGCDSYDCLPDDIDDPELYANEQAEPALASSKESA